MTDHFDVSTLNWVKGEIDETLKEARLVLEKYAENPEDNAQIQFCSVHLHQVAGTLEMVELYGAAQFAAEMEKLADALPGLTARDSAFEVLMRTLLLLPDYLEVLQSGQPDSPLILLPLLNELRRARGEKELTAAAVFLPNLDVELPPLHEPDGDLQTLARKWRPRFQAAMLGLFKGSDPAANAKMLGTVFDHLAAAASNGALRHWFWVGGGVSEALGSDAMVLDAPTKLLLGKYEQVIKQLTTSGEEGLNNLAIETLLRATLFEIGKAAKSGPRLDEVRKLFRLDALLPPAEVLEKIRTGLGGFNSELKKAVSRDVMEELSRIKDVLDLFGRSRDRSSKELQPVADALTHIADVLGLLRENLLGDKLRSQVEQIRGVIRDEQQIDEPLLMALAQSVLSIESALSDWGAIAPMEKADDAQGQIALEEATPEAEAEHRRVVRQVMKEAKDDLVKAREAINAYVLKPNDSSLITEAPRLLHQIVGSLVLLSYRRAAQVLKACQFFIERDLAGATSLPLEEKLDSLADAMMSVEYYLEAFVESRVHPSSVLDVAERAVAKLGYAVETLDALEEQVPRAVVTDAQELDQDALAAAFGDIGELEGPSQGSEVAAPAASVAVESAPKPAAKAPATEMDEEIVAIFIEEAEDEFRKIGELLPRWGVDFKDVEALRELRRSFHTLKGSGRLVGATILGEFAWAFESLLNRIIDQTVSATPEVLALLEQALQTLPALLTQFRGGLAPQTDLAGLQERAAALAKREPPVLGAMTPSIPSAAPSFEIADPVLREIYTKEAEMHLAQISSFVADCAISRSRVTDALVRAIHTLCGSSRTAGVPVVAELAATIEKWAKVRQSSGVPVEIEAVDLLGATVAFVHGIIGFLHGTQPKAPVIGELQHRAEALLRLVQQESSEASLPLAQVEAEVEAPRDAALSPEIEKDEVEHFLETDEAALASAFENGEAEGELPLAPPIEVPEPSLEELALIALPEATAPEVVEPPHLAGLEKAEEFILSALEEPTQAPANEAITLEFSFPELKEIEQAEAEAFTPAELPSDANAEAAELFDFAILEEASPAPAAQEERLPEFSFPELEEIGQADLETPVEAVPAVEPLGEFDFAALNEPSPASAAQEELSPEFAFPELEEIGQADLDMAVEAVPAAAAVVEPLGEIALEQIDESEFAEQAPEEIALSIPDAPEVTEAIPALVSSPAQATPELLDVFANEATDLLGACDELLQEWRERPHDRRPVEALQRLIHTLKGSARWAGVMPMADLGHALESTFAVIVEGRLPATDSVQHIARRAQDRLEALLAEVKGGERPTGIAEIIDELKALVAGAATHGTAGAASHVRDYDPELLSIFLEEGHELLNASDETLQSWMESPDNKRIVENLQRQLHTLKGGARMAGVPEIGDLGHSLESMLAGVVDNIVAVSPRMFTLMQHAQDRLAVMLEQLRNHDPVPSGQDLIDQINAVVSGKSEPAPAVTAAAAVDAESQIVVPPAELAAEAIAKRELSDELEMQEQEREQALERRHGQRAQYELVRVRSDLLDSMVNVAGEASIFRSRVEQQIGTFRFNLGELTQVIERLRDRLRLFDIETEAQIQSRYEEAAQQGYEDFDPLEFDRFTNMQQISRSMMESLGDLSSIGIALQNVTRETETLLVQQARVNTELQEGLMHTRMVPLVQNAPRLRRIVRQTCEELGKQAELRFKGAEVEMDRNVVERIMASLEHLLRNAIAHGIEMPEVREANGKARGGVIVIHQVREGSEVVIRITDDGAGINVQAVREKAIARGLMSPDAQFSDKEIVPFILESGFSTAEALTQISGRGVGMDVVNSEVKGLNGSLTIDTEHGKGTTFTIRLPMTLTVSRALLIYAGEDMYAVPLLSIEGIVRASDREIMALLAQESPKYPWLGQDYDVLHLASVLGATNAITDLGEGHRRSILLAHSGEHRVALIVDGLLGSREIVVKPVGRQLGTLRALSGATILGDGRVALILELPALIRAGLARRSEKQEIATTPAKGVKPVVMVVDDSITVRKVTSRLLERSDMVAVSAKDGIEAVAVLQETIPDVMLLDIEMPRMDGYELATHVRNDARLQQVPIIMITSRSGEKHRQRAMQIGVDVYMTKPFQESELLENIRNLLQKKSGRGASAAKDVR